MYIAAFRQRCVQMLLPGPNKGLHCLPHVDNTATLAGSIKGILGRVKLCTPIFHALQCAYSNRRSCKPWFGLVYSEDNLSNLLSREKFELLKQLRSTGRVLDRPTMATFGCDKADVPGLTMDLA